MLHSAVFWLWVSLALFVLVVIRPGVRTVLHLLDRKRAAIDLHLSEAARLRQEAADLLAKCQQQMQDEIEEARRMIANAEADARHIREEAGEKLKETLALRESVALSHIAEAEAAAVRNARAFASTLALETTREILAHHLPPEIDDLLVDQAITEVPEKMAVRVTG